MLHQDRPANPAYGGGQGGGRSSSLRLLSNSQQQQPNRKCDKDGNFNFLGGEVEDRVLGLGDENRNQVLHHPRNLGPLGRDPPLPSSSSSSSSTLHYSPGPLSPLSRLPCWSPLETLQEIESGDDGYGRVPPDGAEEGKMEEETGGRMSDDDKGKEPERQGVEEQEEEEEEEEEEGEGEEWGDSDSEFEFSYRSGGSLSSLNMESGGEGAGGVGGWDRIGVGEPGSDLPGSDLLSDSARVKWDGGEGLRGRKTGLPAHLLDNDSGSDTDPCAELPEMLGDAVWTLRDRERFKAQEMEKHQVQLTMYRRLALIRWVRTLQGRVQEQQNRLQSSFDVILTNRKELLRMGATTATAAAASQS